MAVNKKGLRKVNHKGRQYLWYANDVDKWVPDQGFVEQGNVRVLHIISSNKKFIVHYRIPSQGDAHAQLKIEGPQFPRQPGSKMVQVPRWKFDTTRYPKADFVRRLIGWCMEEPHD
jgi:hypothetical protein